MVHLVKLQTLLPASHMSAGSRTGGSTLDPAPTMCLAEQAKMVQVLEPQSPMWETHLPVDGRSLSLPFSLCNFAFQINKSLGEKIHTSFALKKK